MDFVDVESEILARTNCSENVICIDPLLSLSASEKSHDRNIRWLENMFQGKPTRKLTKEIIDLLPKIYLVN